MNILSTIVPVFSVIFLGWMVHQRGFIPKDFLGPANRLVYYLAIPAMIFRAVAKTSFHHSFNVPVIGVALLSMLLIFFIAWSSGLLLRTAGGRLATFVQSSFHCNIGYIGLAISYYYLGAEGFARSGIAGGFLMILQNFLAVVILSFYGTQKGKRPDSGSVLVRIFGNPIILSAGAGILFSLFALPVPLVVARILDILSGLALPMALLLIGASLSPDGMKDHFPLVGGSTFLKLLLLPGLAFVFYHLLDTPPEEYLPALILLASPSATITYILARQMRGDPELAVTAISTSTILSALTFTLWLNL